MIRNDKAKLFHEQLENKKVLKWLKTSAHVGVSMEELLSSLEEAAACVCGGVLTPVLSIPEVEDGHMNSSLVPKPKVSMQIFRPSFETPLNLTHFLANVVLRRIK